jgi:hypothetical protein
MKMKGNLHKLLLAVVTIVVLAGPDVVLAKEDGTHNLISKDNVNNFEKPSYSPYVGRNFPTKPLFGDTHLHTSISLDAFGAGNKLGAEEAYRFARGEEVRSATGQRVRLSRPLDFLVIADHAEIFTTMELYKGNPDVLVDERTRKWHKMLNSGDSDESWQAVMEIVTSIGDGTFPESMKDRKVIQSVWRKHLALTELYNEPGKFTAFGGYEWSSMPGGDNLHRVVIFKDGADTVGKIIPFSANDSNDPEDMWKFLAAYEKDTGGSVLAIPHNGNLSNGLMFDTKTWTGKALSKAYANTRMRWEPLYEATQLKGDSEAHPFLSPNDEFADYETWDAYNLDMSKKNEKSMIPREYAREALKNGLALETKLGVNPFKFGIIGSTDSHISLAAVEEENFLGKYSNLEPSAERWNHVSMKSVDGKTMIMGWQAVSSGYAAVWATENTREAIFDAMKRKETYATTGPRMVVRFFGGWDFVEEDTNNRLPAKVGYEKGVPMGGDLYNAPKGKAPTFLVAALRDPYSGNLDRIQIIKGWLDAKGKTQEKVFNVAWSGDRKLNASGKLSAVGNTVDVANATWKNTIGSSELLTVWKDPDFDPEQRAFYYVRVIEIPTPRWTAYDAKRYDVKMSDEVPMVTQERAYTSPIWYTP